MNSISAVNHGAHQDVPVEDINTQAPSDEQEQGSSSLSSSTSSNSIWDLSLPPDPFRLAHPTSYDTLSSAEESSLGPFFDQLPLDILTHALPQFLEPQEWFRTLSRVCKGFYVLTKDTRAIEQIATNMGIRFEEKSLETIKGRFALTTTKKIQLLKGKLGRTGAHELYSRYEELVNQNTPFPNQFIHSVKSLYTQTALEQFFWNLPIPDQINTLLNQSELTPQEIQILENHYADRAIITLWKILADTANVEMPFEMTDQFLQSIPFVEQQASQFPSWCKKSEVRSQLEKIERLDLDKSKIPFLPKELCTLKNLEAIFIEDARLTTLPSDFDKLVNLKVLYIRENWFTSVPQQIFKMTSLTTLQIQSCLVTKVPPAISALQNLNSLWLEFNEINEISDEICTLKNLNGLNLFGNRLRTLPKNFGQLQNLSYLILGQNHFEEIPKQIFQLKLDTLDISDNNLREFPVDLCKLNHLLQLDIQNISCSAPEDFKWPPNIERLYQ